MKVKYRWICEYCGAEVVTYECGTPDARNCPVGREFYICDELSNDYLHKWIGEPIDEDN